MRLTDRGKVVLVTCAIGLGFLTGAKLLPVGEPPTQLRNEVAPEYVIPAQPVLTAVPNDCDLSNPPVVCVNK